MPLNKDNEIYISNADYAIAMIYEVQNKEYVQKHFSVVLNRV